MSGDLNTGGWLAVACEVCVCVCVRGHARSGVSMWTHSRRIACEFTHIAGRELTTSEQRGSTHTYTYTSIYTHAKYMHVYQDWIMRTHMYRKIFFFRGDL